MTETTGTQKTQEPQVLRILEQHIMFKKGLIQLTTGEIKALEAELKYWKENPSEMANKVQETLYDDQEAPFEMSGTL